MANGKKCLQACASNITIAMKHSVNKAVSATFEAAGLQSEGVAKQAADLSAHLLKRVLDNLLTSNIIGSGKVFAFEELLGREKFWIASFGVAADLACYTLLPIHLQACIFQHRTSPWFGMALEMWHIAR
jgi:hypothetical protein